MNKNALLNMRNQRVGGTVVRPHMLTMELQPVHAFDWGSCSRAVFVVHGFNVSGLRAPTCYDAFSAQLGLPLDNAYLGVMWPGDSDLFGIGVYPFAETTADLSAALLRDFIAHEVPFDLPIVVIAHSLGCRVALQALKLLDQAGRRVNMAVLLAAAVDADSLSKPARYRAAVERTDAVWVVHSTYDQTLNTGFPVGDAIGAIISGGYMMPALGWRGPWRGTGGGLPRTVSGLDVGNPVRVDHSDYLPAVTFDATNAPHAAGSTKQECVASFVAKLLAGDPNPDFVCQNGSVVHPWRA